ncbi:MAG: hypothetical protein VKJ44_02085 [Synechococcus sp.]|nr:hypothetical protein [Synechococcus sp.]
MASTAEAYATVPVGVVAFQPQDTEIASSGGLSGKAVSSLRADAITVGDDPTADYAKAFADGTDSLGGAALIVTAGLDLAAGSTTIGASTQLLGSAAFTAQANSTSVQGDSTAGAAGFLTSGISLANPALGAGQTLNAGDAAAIRALADVALIAKAVAVDGDAKASTLDPNGSFTIGLGGSGAASTVAIGTDGVIEASAKDNATATAVTVVGSTTPSDFAADAQSQRSFVQAISLYGGSLTTGDALAIQADASSVQVATAQSSGTADATSPGNGSKASAAEASAIVGLDGSDNLGQANIEAGGNITALRSNASLNTSAAATSVEGHSFADAASGAVVAGGRDIALKAGNDATAGLFFSAVSDTLANAASTSGWASASSTGINVVGISAATTVPNTIQIGDDAGVISGTAVNNVTTRSSTTEAPDLGGAPPAPSAAPAQSYSRLALGGTYGMLNTAIEVGGDATIQGKSATTLNSQANIVTGNDADPSISAASSSVDTTSAGISLTGADSIQIGAQGSVQAQALLGLTSSATSIDSAATAATAPTSSTVELAQAGLEMAIPIGKTFGEITIGQLGSIIADSLISRLADANQAVVAPLLSSAISVSDATKSELINNGGYLTSYGISGGYDTATQDFSSLNAGAAGGNVAGRSRVFADISAVNVGELGNVALDSTALAGSAASPTGGTGITQVNISAGQKGSNQIVGESTTDIDLASTSIHGNATSTGFLGSGAILKTDPFTTPGTPVINGKATVAGSMQAISQLLGTSLAQTINGGAQSGLTSVNLGIFGYDATVPSSGGFSSIASNSTSSKSVSVTGSV